MIVQSSRTPSLGLNSVALLDVLRAFAANIVLAEHAGSIFGRPSRLHLGTIGVGIFFILSGFLITHSSLARITRPGPYFVPYLTDRFARIFTAYVPALIFVAVINAFFALGHWGQEGDSRGPAAFAGNLLLLQDYPLFQAADRLFGRGFHVRAYNTAEPFWTIPIEFWIYVVFGLGFFALAIREKLPAVLIIVCALVALPVVIWNAAAGGGNGLSLVWLAGAAASYLWTRSWSGHAHKMQLGLVVIVLGGVALAGRGAKTDWNFQDIGLILIEAAVFLGMLSVAEALPTLPRHAARVCTFLASYSYSLYLTHNTVLILTRQELSASLAGATFPLALLLCHATAFLMYLAFERHYRHVGSMLKQHLILPQPASAR